MKLIALLSGVGAALGAFLFKAGRKCIHDAKARRQHQHHGDDHEEYRVAYNRTVAGVVVTSE